MPDCKLRHTSMAELNTISPGLAYTDQTEIITLAAKPKEEKSIVADEDDMEWSPIVKEPSTLLETDQLCLHTLLGRGCKVEFVFNRVCVHRCLYPRHMSQDSS